MKNKAGIFSGFVFGMVGFLVMFKFVFLDRIPPSDELAPGMVVIASLFSGLAFGFAGHWVQNRFGKRTTRTEFE